MNKNNFDMKHILFGSLNRRLTTIFFLVAIVAPTIGIAYFYAISMSVLYQDSEMFQQQLLLLQTTASFIILIIAVDAAIIGFYVSRSISKPLKQLYHATKELEKGNFSVQTDIRTSDELEQLSKAFNNTAHALSHMNEERQQIDKAKSEFISITSHELRTPLTPMKAQLQMLENGFFGKLTKKQQDSVTILRRNAERLDRIIEDFLEVSRIEAARLRFVFKKVDLRTVVQETMGFMLGFAQEKDISLLMKTHELPLIEADPDRISQVLRNLIHNAIKFSPEHSTIEVAAVQQNDFILFSVKDEGVGLSSENQIRVFEPFYQVDDTIKRQHGGTGLGLTICRGIVESQKGKIWIESTLGKGSTFYFTVPLQPVYEIEPIRVLFSEKKSIEKKIQDEFTCTLGPMGLVEFLDLKQRQSLGKQDLLDYAQMLGKLSILQHDQEEEFKHHIKMIYGEENA